MPDPSKSTDAFENVRNQIGYCGIWCGSCAVGNGALQEITARYRRLIDAYGLREWGPKDLNYDRFFAELVGIEREATCPGCRRGGGRAACEMRACARSRDIEHCGDCLDPACAPDDALRSMRSGARAAGLFVRPQGADHRELIAQWRSDLRSVWPSSVLFDEAPFEGSADK